MPVQRIRIYQKSGETLGLVVGLVVLWQFVTQYAHALYFPTPWAIAQAIGHNWITWSAFSENVVPSFVRVTMGWGLAGAVGISLGIIVGSTRGIAAYIDPLIHFARAIPPPVVLPVFLIFFGVGNTMKILFIAFGVVWPILINTIKGVQSIEPVQIETAKVYQIGGARKLMHIVLPAASPEIFAGLRISLALAFVLMVISEMISASGGVGYQILQSQADFDVIDMWAGMVILGAGGIVFSSLLGTVEARLLRWKRGGFGDATV